METQQQKSVNGIDVEKLESTLKSIQHDSDLADFRFHIVNEWIGGTKSETSAQRIDNGPQITIRTEPFKMRSDQPCVLMGADSAPCAVVSLLHSLASCLSVSIVYVASRKNVKIDKISIILEGGVDVHRILDTSDEIHPGLRKLDVHIKIESDSPSEVLEEIICQAQKHSIVLDALINQTDLSITLH